MGKLFRIDSPFYQIMSELFDLVMLNILFLLTSIPVITIGAGLTAMHSVGIKQVMGNDVSVAKTYFQEFKKNFRQATLIWIPLLLLGIFLLYDYFLAANGGIGGMGMQFIFGVLVFLYLCELHYIFPLISRYKNSGWRSMKNAILIAIRYLPKTFLLIAISILPPVIAICGNVEIFVIWQVLMLVIGCSLSTVLKDRILYRIFVSLEEQTL